MTPIRLRPIVPRPVRPWHRATRPAFTLIELMVSVAIIALLLAILIPGFGAVTTNAKKVKTQSTYNTLSRGLETFRGERNLGGYYPPSHTDNFDDPQVMANPLVVNDPNAKVLRIAGANLLVYGLMGADQLGTPGFLDYANDDDALWHNNQGSNTVGDDPNAYYLDMDTREPQRPRYPGNQGSYVDEATRATIRSYVELFKGGVAVTNPAALPTGCAAQPFFTDAWGRPILYFRAHRGAVNMVSSPNVAGVYDNRDNALFTGSTFLNLDGLDFGPGYVDLSANSFHRLALTNTPGPDPMLNAQGVHEILVATNYDNTFERYLLDPSVKQRNTPVNRDSFLLISAGPDAVFGSEDDVTNWSRE